ncbi:MAG: glycoside hydrolase family 3 N-terminal domain-containing protein [Candidatus Acetothermia bacterium]
MTLSEKVAQLGSVLPGELLENGELSEKKAGEVLSDGIGHITKPGGESGFSPEKTARFVNSVQEFLREETRLGIPALIHEESLSGYMGVGGVAYPQIIGLSSSWNPGLIKEITEKIGERIRAIGGHQVLAPVLDIARDPRWGRVEETFGEDPYLVAWLGCSYIEGLQKGDLYATAKHFVAHGAPEGGRNHSPANITKRDLRENFLYPFEVAVKKTDIEAVMSAYNEIDGIPCSCSKELLTEILRDEWGFDGFVISDGHSIKMLQRTHGVARSDKEAAIKALEAGLDLEGPTTECFGEVLLNAVKSGQITEADIDSAVRRQLKAKIRKGLLDDSGPVDENDVGKHFKPEEGQELARRAAKGSIVLLKNEDDLLPLPAELDSVAVVGPNANSRRNLLGDYSYGGHMEKDDGLDSVVTLLEGIRAKVSPETKVSYAKGCEVRDNDKSGFERAISITEESELAIVAVGGKSGFGLFPPEGKTDNCGQTTGEGNDRTNLKLPGSQRQLLRELKNTGTPVVTVLVNGRPLAVTWVQDNLPAILEAWLPGEEGGNAIADVLFGDYNPSGKLPLTIPRNSGQIPMHYRRKPISKQRRYVFDEGQPLYSFGYGLSYTDFVYSDLKIYPSEVELNGMNVTVEISCKVENTGDIAGKETVQLYVSREYASVTRPEVELKGAAKVKLHPGEAKRVSFKLPTDLLAFYNADMELVIEPGTFKIQLGSSSDDIRLQEDLTVNGDKVCLDGMDYFFSETEVIG